MDPGAQRSAKGRILPKTSPHGPTQKDVFRWQGSRPAAPGGPRRPREGAGGEGAERSPPLSGGPAPVPLSPLTRASPGPASSPKGLPGHSPLPGPASGLADSWPPHPQPRHSADQSCPATPPPLRLETPVSTLRGRPPTLGIPSWPQSKGLSTLGAAGRCHGRSPRRDAPPRQGRAWLTESSAAHTVRTVRRPRWRQGRVNAGGPLSQGAWPWVGGPYPKQRLCTGPTVPEGAHVGNGDSGHGYPWPGTAQPSRTSSCPVTPTLPT